MKPNPGDIVQLSYGSPRTYFGVLLQRREHYGSDSFVVYSADAGSHRDGHAGGMGGAANGHWYTMYREDLGNLDSGVMVIPVPVRKTVPLDGVAYLQLNRRVTLSVQGRIMYNVHPVHGGPYGEGITRGCPHAGFYLVCWDTGYEGTYAARYLDVVCLDIVQKSLWEEVCPRSSRGEQPKRTMP